MAAEGRLATATMMTAIIAWQFGRLPERHHSF
jgi:hypothetical protein